MYARLNITMRETETQSEKINKLVSTDTETEIPSRKVFMRKLLVALICQFMAYLSVMVILFQTL